MAKKRAETAAGLYHEAAGLPCGKAGPSGATDEGWVKFKHFGRVNEDGLDATVFITRMPALFSRVQFGGVVLDFGSGKECLWVAVRLARLAASGMVGEGE